MRRSLFVFVTLFIFLFTACSEQSVWKGQQRNSNQSNEQDPMLSFKAATSLERMLSEGPGKYLDEVDTHQLGPPTFSKKLLNKLHNMPKTIKAQDAYNRLIYLLAQDYDPLMRRMKQYDSRVPLSSQRKSALKLSSALRVQIVLVLDASSSQSKKMNSALTRFEQLRREVRDELEQLRESPSMNIEYSIAVHTYGGKVDKYTAMTPLAQTAKILPILDQVQPGGASTLSDALDQVKQELVNLNSPNILNQVFVVSSGRDALDEQAQTKAKELLYSEAQAQVHTISFENKDQKLVEELEDIAFAGLGEYNEADVDMGFDLGDKSTGNGSDFGLREYSDLFTYTWAEMMTTRKRNQLVKLEPKFATEFTQLTAAIEEMQMEPSEKERLLHKVEERRDRIGDYLKGRMDTLLAN